MKEEIEGDWWKSKMLCYICLRTGKTMLFPSENILGGVKGDGKESHMERIGILPQNYKLGKMKHSRVMGTIITSSGSKNCAAEASAATSCLDFSSTVW